MSALRLSARPAGLAAAGYSRKLTSWAAAARGKKFTLFLPWSAKTLGPR